MKIINFPKFFGVRCLMMPFIQGNPDSVPDEYRSYDDIIASIFLKKGDVGFLTIDEAVVSAGVPHRGARAKFGRALHTEVGQDPNKIYCWGGGGWGKAPHKVTLDHDVRIMLANNVTNSCAIWFKEHERISDDGDIGDQADQYQYEDAVFMRAGEVHEIGIKTPHESLPVQKTCHRQFLRIISSGVHGREDYFTQNPRMDW